MSTPVKWYQCHSILEYVCRRPGKKKWTQALISLTSPIVLLRSNISKFSDLGTVPINLNSFASFLLICRRFMIQNSVKIQKHALTGSDFRKCLQFIGSSPFSPCRSVLVKFSKVPQIYHQHCQLESNHKSRIPCLDHFVLCKQEESTWT